MLNLLIEGTDVIKQKITSSIERTSNAIEQISTDLNSTEKQIDTLDINLSDNLVAIEEVTQNISNIDEQIANQSSMVEQSTVAITEMIASLYSVSKIAQNKKETTQELSKVAIDGKDKIEETKRNFKSVV